MPNQPKTPARTFRIPVDVSAALDAKAEGEGRTATDVLVAALRRQLVEDGYLTPPSPPRG